MKKKRTFRLDNIEVVSTLRSVERALENTSYANEDMESNLHFKLKEEIDKYKSSFPSGLSKGDPIVCNYTPYYDNTKSTYLLYGNVVGFEIDLKQIKLILLVRPKVKSRKQLGSRILDLRTDILHFQFDDINFDLT